MRERSQIGKQGLRYDIVIVGAGPAGLSLARALSDAVPRIAVIDKLPEDTLAAPSPDGRDIALTHFSAWLLRKLGVWSRFPDGAVSRMKEARVLNGRSSYFLNFDPRAVGKDTLGYLVPNHVIRKAVYEAVVETGNVQLITGAEVASVKTGSRCGEVFLTDGRVLESMLVVAADSRFSETRRKMGIQASMQDFGSVAIVCQMEHALPHNGIAFECFFYDRTLAVLPLCGNRSSVVLTLPGNALDEMLAVDKIAFNREIEALFVNRLGAMRLAGERYHYPLVAVYADRFVAERFALVGDAAVGMHPVTAHGFNLGLRGVDTLSAEIKSARAAGMDIGALGHLERYQRKHRLATMPLYLGTNAIVGLYTETSFPARVMRHAILRLGNRLRPTKHIILNRLTEGGSPVG